MVRYVVLEHHQEVQHDRQQQHKEPPVPAAVSRGGGKGGDERGGSKLKEEERRLAIPVRDDNRRDPVPHQHLLTLVVVHDAHGTADEIVRLPSEKFRRNEIITPLEWFPGNGRRL